MFTQGIAIVSQHGGAVLRFIGDAVLCFFEVGVAAETKLACLQLALQCAQTLETQMGRLTVGDAELTLHLAVVTGRFAHLLLPSQHPHQNHHVLTSPNLSSMESCIQSSMHGEVVMCPK